MRNRKQATVSGDEWKTTMHRLTPQYDAEQHGYYVALLRSAITAEDEPPRNIAVAGAYGSGKSSVLAGLREALPKRFHVVEISLATLTKSRAELLEVAGETTLAAALQKEVVKRLLYSAKPSKLPRSRFERIRGVRWSSAVALALVAAIVILGLAHMLDTPTPFAAATSDWASWAWLGVVLDGAVIVLLAITAQAALSSFRVREIGFGSAKLSLDDKGSNYFDKYLDEVVYFFQKSKTRVVVFEDLDRFDDPGIFLALRELNNLLNSAEQIGRHVTFVHAIRDSLFAQAVTESGDQVTEDSVRLGADAAASARAKFFDLVIPLVPFISHDVSADLMMGVFEDVPAKHQPDRSLMALAGRHITDMRVIYSIRNEYVVFCAELLDAHRVEGLDRDQLFAMVLYKHAHMDDFERIRTGDSRLDRVMAKATELTRARLAAIESEIATVTNDIDLAISVDRRAEDAGNRLLAGAQSVFGMTNGNSPVNIQRITIVGGSRYPVDEVKTRAFWEAVASAPDARLDVASAGHGTIAVLPGDRRRLSFDDFPPGRWLKGEVVALRATKTSLATLRQNLRRSSLSRRLTDPVFNGEGLTPGGSTVSVDIATECAALLPADGLALDLVRGGHIDQHFALYTTKFHGRFVSAEAQTYLMQFVDRHRNDPLFSLSPNDVEQIIKRTDGELLRNKAVLNVSIFDELADDERIDAALDVLLVEPGPESEDFVVTYLNEGSNGVSLVQRLTARWDRIIDVLALNPRLSAEKRRDCLDQALATLTPDIEYVVSPEAVEVLREEIEELTAPTRVLEGAAAAALANLLEVADLKVKSLAEVKEPLRSLLGERSAFELNRSNLQALVPDESSIGIDELKDVSQAIAAYVVGDVAAYESAISEEPAVDSISLPERLLEVLQFVASTGFDSFDVILARAPEGAACASLVGVPEVAFRALVRTRRVALTVENVALYLDAVGVLDDDLATYMELVGSVEVAEGEPQATRHQVAMAIVDCATISTTTKLEIVSVINPEEPLDVAPLTIRDGTLLAGLIASGAVSDSPEMFNELDDAPWDVYEAGVGASSAFAGFVHEVSLNSERLSRLFGSNVIRDDVRRAVVSELSRFAPNLDRRAADAVLAFAVRDGMNPTPDLVAMLTRAGARPRSMAIYVALRHTGLDDVQLLTVVAAMPDPYANLGNPNGDSLTLPHDEEFAPVLQRMKELNYVESFRKGRGADSYTVVMKAATP